MNRKGKQFAAFEFMFAVAGALRLPQEGNGISLAGRKKRGMEKTRGAKSLNHRTTKGHTGQRLQRTQLVDK